MRHDNQQCCHPDRIEARHQLPRESRAIHQCDKCAAAKKKSLQLSGGTNELSEHEDSCCQTLLLEHADSVPPVLGHMREEAGAATQLCTQGQITRKLREVSQKKALNHARRTSQGLTKI